MQVIAIVQTSRINSLPSRERRWRGLVPLGTKKDPAVNRGVVIE
jgi:hypothetical protein